MPAQPKVGVRWTVGDVSVHGFDALRLSIWGAWKVFGPEAGYVVCVNSIPLEKARCYTQGVPDQVCWHDSTGDLPEFLRRRLDGNLAEGVAWKFAPLRIFPDCPELALDNDCILWDMPAAIRSWLAGSRECVIAEDVRCCLGKFAELCGPEPRNSGIRGLPIGFDLETALRELLARRPDLLNSELDEQGLQVALVSRGRSPHVVRVDEVTVCSPFPPHLPHLGTCGAHFVGLNARHLPWTCGGKPAVEHLRAHWLRHRDALYEKVELPTAFRGCA